jgi:hypothetical protein
MTTFPEFADWLFPGDDLSRQRNPDFHTLDPEVQNLLAEVECRSGIDRSWLARVAGLVVDGLAGLQCLWFLHGASGEVHKETFGAPGPLNIEKNALLLASEDRLEKKHPDKTVKVVMYWDEGYVEHRFYTGYSTHADKITKTKLGKWLRKQGASQELRHAFETREMPVWHWRISADPLDVLTMSFRRPWTSCMRPPDPEGQSAGEAQYGPLTDMAAGAAVLFFYRPGADVPCGRMMLRPASSGTGMIVLWPGQRVYGCGPTLVSADELEAMLRPYLEPHRIELHDTGLCWVGERGFALSRLVYSDVDNSFCRQSDEQYDAAYVLLDSLPWPESEFVGDQLRPEALKWQGEVGMDISPEGGLDVDIAGTIDSITGNFLEVYDLQQLWELSSELTDMIDDVLPNYDATISSDDDLRDDVYNGVGENIDRHIMAVVNEAPTDVLIVRDVRDLDRLDYRDRDPLASAIQRLENEYGAQVINSTATSEDNVTNLLSKLGLPYGDDSLWFIGVSLALWNEQEAYPEALQEESEGLRLDPGEWDWQAAFLLDR